MKITKPFCRFFVRRLVAAVVVSGLLSPAAPAEELDPLAKLSEMLADPQQANVALVALCSTEDPDLRPLLEALSRSRQLDRRMFAVAALSDLFASQAAATLKERLAEDTSKAVRIAAMTRLLADDALSVGELREALNSTDEELRALAANGLVRKGEGQTIVKLLAALSESPNKAVACSARLNLVTLGYNEHLAAVDRIVNDPQTSEALLTQILSQIGEERIAAAVPLAMQVAASDRHRRLRMHAYWAISDAAPDARAVLMKAIGESDQTVIRVNLLAVLAQRDDAEPQLRELANQPGAIGSLAKFELLRKKGLRSTAGAASEALASGHPVVAGYVLDRAAEDVKERSSHANFYAPVMLACIRSANPNSATMTAEHYRAARAATILSDLASEEAVEGLRSILAGRYNATVRAAAAGLLRSKTAAARELARPLLTSPYEELVSDAAIVLGGFGDPAANDALQRYASGAGRHPPALVAMSCWYLLKISGQSQFAAEQLAETIR